MEWTNYVAEKRNEGILFSAEIRVVGSYTDRLLSIVFASSRSRLNALRAPNYDSQLGFMMRLKEQKEIFTGLRMTFWQQGFFKTITSSCLHLQKAARACAFCFCLGISRPSVLATSTKWIDRKGLGKRVQGLGKHLLQFYYWLGFHSCLQPLCSVYTGSPSSLHNLPQISILFLHIGTSYEKFNIVVKRSKKYLRNIYRNKLYLL